MLSHAASKSWPAQSSAFDDLPIFAALLAERRRAAVEAAAALEYAATRRAGLSEERERLEALRQTPGAA
jgi:hypothetical protein